MAYCCSLILPVIAQLLFSSPVCEALPWGPSQVHPSRDPILHVRQVDINATTTNNTFDYVVVGGGTAGLTVVSRLSEDPSVRVAVVEAGDFYETTTGNLSQIPAHDGYYNGKDPANTGPSDWDFVTTSQEGINNEKIHYARGKTFGGSSALNYMAYQRTSVGALQKWADEVGDSSWTYDNAFEYYRKSTNFTPPDLSKRPANATPDYDAASFGQDGPLDISFPDYAQAMSTWVAKALPEFGMPNTDGFTSGRLEGGAWLVNTINPDNGYRESSEAAFLRPILDRPNLFVFPRTLGEKIIFDGTKATGVQVSSGGRLNTLKVNKEVIVSAGVFQSPQLLQVSGVGPHDLLQEHGIEVVADRPGVGQGMNDHTFFPITYRVNVQTETALSYGTDAMAQAVEQFNVNGTGLLAGPGGDYAAYEKIPDTLRANFTEKAKQDLATFPSDWPEVEYFTLPGYVGDFQWPPNGAPNDGYQYGTIMLTSIAPLSRGTISISSPSMRDQPLINPAWLTSPTDVELAIAAFKRLRQVFQADVLMQNLNIGEEFYPGLNVTSDEDILAHVKRSFNTMYHASSTCKMGRQDDGMAVVDGKGRVIGVEGVRVADASVFPFLPPGLPMGTVYMVGEKIADAIKKGE